MTNFICLILSKAVITGATKLWFNLYAGLSATDFVDDFFFIVYTVFLTQYGHYTWTEKQLSNQRYSHDESLLKYKLSENYAMIRDNFIKKFKQRWCIFLVMTYWASFCCYLVTMTTMKNTVNASGNTLDQNGMGFATFTCFIFMVHILWISQIRDWNKVLIFAVGLTMIMFPVTVLMSNSLIKGGQFY